MRRKGGCPIHGDRIWLDNEYPPPDRSFSGIDTGPRGPRRHAGPKKSTVSSFGTSELAARLGSFAAVHHGQTIVRRYSLRGAVYVSRTSKYLIQSKIWYVRTIVPTKLYAHTSSTRNGRSMLHIRAVHRKDPESEVVSSVTSGMNLLILIRQHKRFYEQPGVWKANEAK